MQVQTSSRDISNPIPSLMTNHAMSQQMYKAAQPQGGAEPAGAGPGASADKGKDDVIDAEYEVKK